MKARPTMPPKRMVQIDHAAEISRIDAEIPAIEARRAQLQRRANFGLLAGVLIIAVIAGVVYLDSGGTTYVYFGTPAAIPWGYAGWCWRTSSALEVHAAALKRERKEHQRMLEQHGGNV